ncbi:ubiquilin-1-like isoform X2 [Babylonia areolata]|uniref:ubiquilin-1-like isoform X2 n=1 Tax=Babylonia areolata TaxID=304850 RepID=UPI003FD6BD0F
MAENMESSGSDKMTISVKTPKEKHDIEIDVKATVKDLKEEVSKCFGSPLEQLCLIFAGKILKDGDTLEQHGIKDGLTVHLVIKTNRTQGQAAATPSTPAGGAQPSSPQAPTGMGGGLGGMGGGLGGMGGGLGGMGGGMGGMGGGLGDLMGLSGMGMGSGNFQEMQQRMQRELMSNPDMLRQMMENPFVQQMMSNPDIMRQLIMSNPQMRDVMDRNPEITHMLNNPEVMRQTMELARNPAMMQELMRSQDRAMSNLESLPGGFNALQRMYRDIQEPMMSAAQDSLGSNPFASLLTSGSGTGSTQQGRENTDPLPNPWSPGGGTAGTTSTTTTPTANTTTSSSPSPGTPSSTTSTQGLLGAQGSMFSTPGMQSLMQQMMQNPQMIQSMMQAPYMQSMLQSMAANPQLAQQIMSANPMFANNPQLMEQFRTQLPTMMQQLSNPQVQAAISNPRVMEAMMQIQRGVQTLHSEAPSLVMGVPGAPASSTTPPTTAAGTNNAPTSPQPSSPGQPSTTTTTTPGTDGAPTPTTTGTGSEGGTTPLVPPMGNQEAFNNMMAQLTSMMVGGQLNQPPEQRYASQLEQLTAMGFVDREANIRALTATLGDVNAAIDRLLQQR